jgi:hypothetical protein
VQHRWLDESAPPKLSPAQAAMVQQNELLGPEPLSLDGAFKAAEGPSSAAQDAQLAETKPVVPTTAPAVPGVIAPMVVDAPATAASAVEAAEQAPDQAAHARAAPRGRRGRAPAGRGRKRKPVADDEEYEPEDDAGAAKGEGFQEAAEV